MRTLALPAALLATISIVALSSCSSSHTANPAAEDEPLFTQNQAVSLLDSKPGELAGWETTLPSEAAAPQSTAEYVASVGGSLPAISPESCANQVTTLVLLPRDKVDTSSTITTGSSVVAKKASNGQSVGMQQMVRYFPSIEKATSWVKDNRAAAAKCTSITVAQDSGTVRLTQAVKSGPATDSFVIIDKRSFGGKAENGTSQIWVARYGNAVVAVMSNTAMDGSTPVSAADFDSVLKAYFAKVDKKAQKVASQ